MSTRSYAALRAADLEWIQFGRVHFGEKNMKNQPGTMKNHKKPWKTYGKPTCNHEKPWKTVKGVGQEQKNVTHAGSQLTSKMGEGVGQE